MLTPRELATTLAALRFWQQQRQHEAVFAENFPHFADELPLTAEEIDALCDRLNLADADSHDPLIALSRV